MNGGTPEPNAALGQYVVSLLQDPSWVRRRVETIRFVDEDTVLRNVTLDVDLGVITARTPVPYLTSTRPVILTTLTKELLVDFDLRDGDGKALPIATRFEDSDWAFQALLAQTAADPEDHQAASKIAPHLYAITKCFPAVEDSPDDPGRLVSWKTPDEWGREEYDSWDRLLRNEEFTRLLLEFTFNFLLITRLPPAPSIQLVKFAYRTNFEFHRYSVWEKLSVRSTQVALRVPTLGTSTSSHVRINAPPELRFTSVELARRENPNKAPGSAGFYHRRISADRAQLYTGPSPAGDYGAWIGLRVPLTGLLRSIMIASVFTAGVMLCAYRYLDRLVEVADDQSDAAVALLLVAPSLLTAYLVQPGEHPIASRVLRVLRYLVALSALSTYLGASIIVLGFSHTITEDWWLRLTQFSVAVAGVLICVALATRSDLRSVEGDLTEEREIALLVRPWEH